MTTLAGVLRQRGWRARTRVFGGLPGLPNPRQRLAMCQMPNNLHVVPATDVAKTCQQQGHTFTDHKITRCVIDGSPLV